MPEPLKLAELKLRMQAYGVKPSKRLGQNILVDFNLLKAVVADAEIDAGDCVLEIGTGAGSLTGYLCDAAGLVISVEVDRGMFEMSRDILTGVNNLIQVRTDALNREGRGLNPALEGLILGALHGAYSAIAGQTFERGFSLRPADDFETLKHFEGAPPRCGRLKLVANLPYSVATSVLIAALESGLPFERILVMVQYDVAEKLADEPGGKHWGLPSLLRWCFADARVVRRVPAKVFWPKPKVESALLEIRPTRMPDMNEYHKLRRLAHVLFQHRRKAASNALSQALGADNKQTSEWIEAVGGNPGDRPEQMAPETLLKLAAHAEVEPLVRKAMLLHEDQLAEKAERLARRAEWKKRVYGDDE